MKRYLSAGLLLCSIILLFFSVYRTSDRLRYSDLLIVESEYKKITDTHASTTRELLTGLSLNNTPSFYDELTGSWFYSVPSHDTEALDPTIGFTPPENDIRIAFSNQIVPGKSIEFIAYNESEYRTYTLAVTTLPLIRIDCGDELFIQMDEQWEEIQSYTLPKEPIPMTFTLIDNRPGNRHPVILTDGTIHIRGGSTLSFPKKGLRITLLEKTAGKEQNEYRISLLGMRQDGDWLLYPAYNDQEKIRNVFSSNLWFQSCADDNSFGLKNGMEYRYVELFLNRQYWGLYALGYPIDAKQMEIKADNQGHYDEFLLKQKAFGPDLEDLENGSNGIILVQNAEQTDLNNAMQLMKMYFSQLLSGNEAILWQNDFDNVVDIWIFLKLCQASDTITIQNQLKNVFYTIKMNPQGRKILFTPWDADNYWGNTWSIYGKNKTNEYSLSAENNSFEMTLNPISFLRLKDPAINDAIRSKYYKLRSDKWSNQNIDEMLDGFEQDIYDSGAYIRDMERWPEGDYQDPNLKLSLFRDYVHRRFNSMDEYIAGL